MVSDWRDLPFREIWCVDFEYYPGLSYCFDDVAALARLVPHIIPTIRSIPQAHMRAQFMWTIAQQERRGVPLDLPLLTKLRDRWSDIQADLVAEIGGPFGIETGEGWRPVYTIGKDGKPHWSHNTFAEYIRRSRIPWPTRADGALDERIETFEDMCQGCPQKGVDVKAAPP